MLKEFSGPDTAPDWYAVFYSHFLTTPTAICFTDCDGLILDANEAFLGLYGYTKDEVLGRNPRILKSGRQSPAVYKEIWSSISDSHKGAWTGEIVNRKKNGDEVYVLLSIAGVRQSNGETAGYVATTIDLTKRKQLEIAMQARKEELENLNKLQSELAAITSHDLKAPLNAILGYANLIRDRLGELKREKIKEYLDRMVEYGTSLTNFITDALDLSKIESGKMELNTKRMHLDAVLSRCVELNRVTASRDKIEISYSTAGIKRPAIADERRMEQVFNNLISNAVKFSPDQGIIEINYRDDGGKMLVITVEDRGPGLPESDLGAVFDRFYQVKNAGKVPARVFGAGLGLSIVRAVVELHGGAVRAENRARGGARFTVEIPVRGCPGSFSDMAAMIVDPLDKIYGYFEERLRSLETAVFTAKDIFEAERIYRYERPDIIFAAEAVLKDEKIYRFLNGIRDGSEVLLVLVGERDEGNADPLFYRTLTIPLTDVEVREVMDDLFLAKRNARGA